MALLIAFRGFDVEGEHFQRRHIGVLQVGQPRGALFREPADDVPSQNEKPTPRHERQKRVLSESRLHPHSLSRLEKEDERGDEETRDYGKATAAKEAGQDDGQIIEAEKRELLLDQGIDDEQRRHEQKNQDALEVPQYEALHHKALSSKEIEAPDQSERRVGNLQVRRVTPEHKRARAGVRHGIR